MKLIIESTEKIVEVNGVPARVWEGKSEGGVQVTCLITRIAVPKDADVSVFERELQEHAPPSPELNAWPLRLVL